MKKLKFLVLGSALFALTGFTAVNTWKNDATHSNLGFSIVHLGISDVAGSFDDYSATIISDREDFSDAIIEATIKAESVNTGVAPRDKHLRSADFFEVEKYPTITFKSTSIKKKKKSQYQVVGDLTAKGITKPVTLTMTHKGTIEHPRSKKPVAGMNLTGKIKRSDFGIGEQGATLSDEVSININAELVKK